MRNRAKTILAASAAALAMFAMPRADAGTLELTYGGPASVISGEVLSASAVLTDDGAPVEGASVTFTLGSASESATTDAAGSAAADLLADLDAGSSTLSITSGAASTTVEITVTHRPTEVVFSGPEHFQLGVNTDTSAYLVDVLDGNKVSGTKLVCDGNGENCAVVNNPLKATFKLGNLPEKAGQSGSFFASPKTDTVIATKLNPNAKGFGVPLVIKFLGNERYAASTLNTTVNVWERIDEDDNHIGTMYNNPTSGEFLYHHYDHYDSGIVTGATFTALATTGYAMSYNGPDAHGTTDLVVAGVVRNGTAQAVFTGTAGARPIGVVSRV